MIWVVGVFLGIIFVVGVVRVVVFLRSRTALMIERGQPLGKRSLVILGFFNVIFSIFGLVLLKSGAEEPLNILIGIIVVGLIYEVGFRKTSKYFRVRAGSLAAFGTASHARANQSIPGNSPTLIL